MLIYLDTKDLINIFERSNPCNADQFENYLRDGGHKLVFSMLNIIEIAEPLHHKQAKTNAMALLNRLEKVPHTYIHSSIIPRLELKAAIEAFTNNKEYKGINPYANRFDDILDLNALPPTKIYLNYPLSEIVWDLYNFDTLEGLDEYAQKLKPTFEADRTLSPKPSLKKHFATTIQRNLKLHNVSAPFENIESFANWIYSNPSRCPSTRLGYEVWHKLRKNITDNSTASDMEDFNHIDCLPYVDMITLDRRMHGYVSQASATLGTDYSSKAYAKLQGIIGELKE